MKSLRVLVLAALCGFVFSACGGDDTPAPTDAGTPVDMPTVPPDLPSIDAGADDAAADDAGPDRDASADIDAGPEDAGPTGDDAGPSDAGREDAGSDLGVDAGALDAGPPPPVRDVDILFMVDNSGSMAEEQASLAAQLPRLVQVLTSGDRTGDGPTPDDFTPIRDLHLGVVTSDMGVGGFTVPSCSASPAFGDDGVLRTQGNPSDPTCMATYPSFLAYVPGAAMETPGEFGARFGCVAVAGTTGCGFEQQLEATLKALTPSTSSVRFRAGTTGHADGLNAGFLRPESLLVAVLFTDEEDCSVQPAFEDLFNSASTTFEGPLTLRCFLYKAPQQPVSRYIDGLRALRPGRPDLLIVAAIAGVPVDLIRPGTPDYTGILADERMVETLDPTIGLGRVTPSCDVPGRGLAFPPRRMVEVAQGFGANGVVQSICQDAFDGAFDAVIARIAIRM
jgi:hypothetical protein